MESCRSRLRWLAATLAGNAVFWVVTIIVTTALGVLGVTGFAGDSSVEPEGELVFSGPIQARVAEWQDSGVRVGAGDTIRVTATGKWSYWRSPDRRQSKECDAGGLDLGTLNDLYLAPGEPAYALVMRIGDHVLSDLGDNTFVVPASGRIFFGINDTVHYGGTADNSGHLDVTIYVL